MAYGWENDELWQLRIDQGDFDGFEQPYIGNGILGTRFDRLVAGIGRKPLYTLARDVYDGGRQILLPAWNHVLLTVGGIAYLPENGRHQAEQVLDIRNGVVTLRDHWEYKDGKIAVISVEMFLPRTFGHASYLSLTVEQLEDEASLTFGILANGLKDYGRMGFHHSEPCMVVGEYRTAKQNRPVAQAIQWNSAGLASFHSVVSAEGIEVSAQSCSSEVKLELFHTIGSYAESEDPCPVAVSSAKRLCSLGRDALLEVSTAEWKKIWRNGIAFRNGDVELEKSILVHQFYLLCSLEECDHPLGPLGLSKNEWGGNQLWDADLWVFRAILPLWPEYAKAIIGFRSKTLNRAAEHARVAGYRGAWYGWQTDEEGRNITLPGFNDELHVNIWIAAAAWEYYLLTGDIKHLSGTGWPLIRSIADFFASRVEMGSDGHYHLNCVLGPDESVFECGQLRVNDNFTTNYGVKRLMEIACEAAGLVSEEPAEEWKTIQENMFLLSPDENGIIPEYKGYNGHGIKQADVILAFYPLGYPADEETLRRNIKYYRDKQMYYGPLMSSQIESCILMKLGEKEAGLKRLFRGMAEFSRGKHHIPFECRDNDNSIMLTGIAGELQALIFGYYEADLHSTGKIPRIAQYMGSAE